MATGALDANGVWQYGEDDPASPVSDLLNLLAASVSSRIGALAAAVASPPPTSATVALTSSWTTNPADVNSLVRRAGRWHLDATIRSAAAGTYSTGPNTTNAVTFGTLPAIARTGAGIKTLTAMVLPNGVAGTGWHVIAGSVDLTSGVIQFHLPNALVPSGTVSAGQFRVAVSGTWEA